MLPNALETEGKEPELSINRQMLEYEYGMENGYDECQVSFTKVVRLEIKTMCENISLL